ncbi:ABC-2 family transporter protein [Ruminiclostridium hungatei]|uniref:ABC-2 family transporter protein n=1 Tax=Ruminiclostridium hungatei TaxID=48256 RepID=A0A1V4SEQ4_RUMHU|nr:ABC transporter permease [Ruminiclostridium hungatei]OPX42392.1 ABC-2 family transporter protein [Ruminiclostridium hungatei]
MFLNIFYNRLKCIVRDKSLIFWTLVFPLILATFFNMAFSNLSKSEALKVVDIAIVDNAQYQRDKAFQNFVEQHSKDIPDSEKDIHLFNVRVVSPEEADRLLDNNEIAGYVTYGEPIRLTVKSSGFNQTIIKEIFDQYSQTVSTAMSIVKREPAALQNGLAEDLGNIAGFTREVQIGTKDKPDITVNYFYTLIAMSCFYGAFFGLKEVTDIQANLSKRAARLNAAPVHKLKVLSAGLFAGLMVSLAEIMLLMGYLVFVLKIDFGNQIGFILLNCLLGCASGISFGALISAANKKSEGVKTAILIVSTMAAAFLAGMMFDRMKYIIQQYVPALSYINPVALITDAFYALYYYDTHTRFYINTGLLGIYTVVFCLVTYMIIRRQKYDNI